MIFEVNVNTGGLLPEALVLAIYKAAAEYAGAVSAAKQPDSIRLQFYGDDPYYRASCVSRVISVLSPCPEINIDPLRELIGELVALDMRINRHYWSPGSGAIP